MKARRTQNGDWWLESVTVNPTLMDLGMCSRFLLQLPTCSGNFVSVFYREAMIVITVFFSAVTAVRMVSGISRLRILTVVYLVLVIYLVPTIAKDVIRQRVSARVNDWLLERTVISVWLVSK